MAITFPSSPSDGDTFTWGGITYVYDATPGYWKSESTGGGGAGGGITYIQTTIPSSGNQGELWWDTEQDFIFVYNSGQWVLIDSLNPSERSDLNYPSGTLANGSGTFNFSIGENSSYTTTSRTVITGFMSSTDSANIDFEVSASSSNKRFKFDLIRATTSGVFVEAGDSGVEGKMYKTNNLSTSTQTPVEGSTSSNGWPWGSENVRWPVRIMADAGITMTSNDPGRLWNFYNTLRLENVNKVYFDSAFAEGVQG